MKLVTPNGKALALLALLALVGHRLVTGALGALDGSGWELRLALAVAALVGVALARAGWSLIVQARASRRLRERVGSLRLPLPAHLGAAALRAGLAGRVDLIAEAEPLSFTYGLAFPRVALSRSLVDTLSADELAAVLEHEAYHVHNRDPSRIMLARAIGLGFFYLPALRPLRDRYLLERELEADRSALRSCGRRVLAGALYRIVPGSSWSNVAPAAGLAGTDMLEARVVQLETGEAPVLPGVSRHSLAVTSVTAGMLCSAVLLSVGGIWGVRPVSLVVHLPHNLLGLGSLSVPAACPIMWAWIGWVGFRKLFRVAQKSATS